MVRRLIDLAMLLGLFVLIGASLLAPVDAIEAGLEWASGEGSRLALTIGQKLDPRGAA